LCRELIPSSIRYYLSERFRLRFEDSGLDELMDEDAQTAAVTRDLSELDPELRDVVPSAGFDKPPHADEGIDMVHSSSPTATDDDAVFAPEFGGGAVRTLDGEIAGDEFAQDAMNYQILLGKIDRLLDNLKLDA
jgi:ankyrin repeat and BTB/POZ domain-containing protein 1